jgi:hypothetical protein
MPMAVEEGRELCDDHLHQRYRWSSPAHTVT